MSLLPEILSGFAGAAVGGWLTLIVAKRQLHVDNVTAERAKWRDKIRKSFEQALVESNPEKRLALWVALKLNTNPRCAYDVDLVDLAKCGIEQTWSEDEQEELLDRAALLLKHDWDRAKREAGEDLVVRRWSYGELVSWKESGKTHNPKSWARQIAY